MRATALEPASEPRDTSAEASGHIPSLDGVRGLAILLVILVHSVDRGPRGVAGSVLQAFYFRLTAFGWTGVDLFFVLSGFLITGILIDTRESPEYFRSFFARRMLRIFPLHYLVLFLTFVVLGPILSKVSDSYLMLRDDQLWFWLYASNWLIVLHGPPPFFILNHFWSLAIEEQFYLAWPFAVFFLPRRWLGTLCISMIAGALVLRIHGVSVGTPPMATYVSTFTRFDTLAIGALIAILSRRPGGLARLRIPAAWLFCACTVAIATIFATRGTLELVDPVVQTVGFTAVGLLCGSLVVLVQTLKHSNPLVLFFSSKFLQFMGRISYGMYVFHWPVLLLIAGFWPVPLRSLALLPAHLVFFGVGLTGSIAVALASWRLVERPFLSLKKHFAAQPAVVGITGR